MKTLLCMIPLLLLASLPARAQSPYPGGPLVDKPNEFYETETQQVGGAGWNWYSYVGALRCSGTNQAIVGVATIKGSVLDYVQIICANISCGPKGCGWSQSTWGPGAGNAKAGTPRTESCPTNMIVAGFRGGSAGNGAYATDIQIECAKLTGKGMGQTQYDGSTSGKQRFGVLPKADVGQGYGRGAFGRTSQKNYNSGPRYSPLHTPFSSSDNQKLSSCMSGGATALSVAVGRWNMFYQVVQAYSMFCANGFDPVVIDEGTNARSQ